ncbi:hypothetical protein Ciccas_010907 [Cichlidogyrus casuarinus]|uniref:RING-type domain-containing protein n=1 Tax=Cichlidogyrus casuarinus TaxID=1844966 RepID=A0ABD2PSS8_9PLAT
MGNCFGFLRRSARLLDDRDDMDDFDYYQEPIPSGPIYHIHPGVKKYASELTEEEQLLIISRMDIIQGIPSLIFDHGLHIEECIICLEPYEDQDIVKSLACGHTYHGECIDKWLMLSSQCPKCLKDVKDLPDIPADLGCAPYPMKQQSMQREIAGTSTRQNHPSCSSDLAPSSSEVL